MIIKRSSGFLLLEAIIGLALLTSSAACYVAYCLQIAAQCKKIELSLKELCRRSSHREYQKISSTTAYWRRIPNSLSTLPLNSQGSTDAHIEG